MKKFRPSNLVKFLQTMGQPFFLLDRESTLLFCNRALEEWTGCSAEWLIGQRLRYRAAASRKKQEIVAAALAPPPEVFQNVRCRQMLTIDRITAQSRRMADFIPLHPGGVLVLVDDRETDDGEDRSDFSENAPVSAERQAAADLHQTLLDFRRRQAGRFRWDRMIGSSQLMQRIRRIGRLAVESTASVLILGEAATGKEHLASSIHYGFPAETPGALVPVECSVLDDELIASTMTAFRKRFQQDKSPRRHTLLLKDAEALSDAFLTPIADFVSSAPANQRIIATSTRRPDSWPNHPSIPILLGTLQIDLPPLKQRKDDIPMLAQMFLEERNRQADRQRAGFTSEALDLLVQYDWPGNLEELESMAALAHEVGSAPLVAAADLPERLRNVFQAAVETSQGNRPIDLERLLGEIEEELIRRALRMARNNKSKAAELLGLTRPKLYRRLEFFGLLDPES